MFWYSFFYILLIAVILSFIFTAGLRNRGPWNNFWILVLVLFLGMGALSVWFAPVGPIWYGVAWLDLLIFGIILALLLGASAEAGQRNNYRLRRTEVDVVAEAKEEPGAIQLFGFFFWLFMVAIIIAIIIGVLRIFEVL